jgi:hypothetical protein
MKKHQFHDLNASCDFSYNLIEFMEMGGDLEEKLKGFDGAFERNEVVDL